ncbi:uncharacterized protein LOC141587985 [Silene latifolia]|uniref:uncharacterized protein LOC141587985 n=1 Tax=Silene latifolia TaxID=37657 RepID=UPI003D76BF53
MALPKHRFMIWLMFRNALNLKDKFCGIGVCSDDKCCVCDADKETINHLFLQCRYSLLILQGICTWLHIPIPTGNGIILIGRRNWAPVQKSICLAVVMAFYYNVWQQRNLARLEGKLLSPRILIAQIQQLFRSRIQQVNLDNVIVRVSNVIVRDRIWLNLLLTIII